MVKKTCVCTCCTLSLLCVVCTRSSKSESISLSDDQCRDDYWCKDLIAGPLAQKYAKMLSQHHPPTCCDNLRNLRQQCGKSRYHLIYLIYLSRPDSYNRLVWIFLTFDYRILIWLHIQQTLTDITGEGRNISNECGLFWQFSQLRWAGFSPRNGLSQWSGNRKKHCKLVYIYIYIFLLPRFCMLRGKHPFIAGRDLCFLMKLGLVICIIDCTIVTIHSSNLRFRKDNLVLLTFLCQLACLVNTSIWLHICSMAQLNTVKRN